LFLLWADLLGNASIVRQYSVDPKWNDLKSEWFHPELVERFQFVYFEQEDMEWATKDVQDDMQRGSGESMKLTLVFGATVLLLGSALLSNVCYQIDL